jgi:hypothetical protein
MCEVWCEKGSLRAERRGSYNQNRASRKERLGSPTAVGKSKHRKTEGHITHANAWGKRSDLLCSLHEAKQRDVQMR